jgi:hypothetical protein
MRYTPAVLKRGRICESGSLGVTQAWGLWFPSCREETPEGEPPSLSICMLSELNPFEEEASWASSPGFTFSLLRSVAITCGRHMSKGCIQKAIPATVHRWANQVGLPEKPFYRCLLLISIACAGEYYLLQCHLLCPAPGRTAETPLGCGSASMECA